jgi:FAD/FMN-containing dehydrogenase
LIAGAAQARRKIRVAGAGHSSSPLVRTAHALIRMDHFNRLGEVDTNRSQAWIGSGMRLQDLGEALHSVGLAMENLGDVDTQTLAGVAATGTHGSGRTLKNISSTVIGVRGVDGTGQGFEWTVDRAAPRIKAAQVSLGALAVFTELRLQLQPAYRLQRREYFARTPDVLDHLDELATAYRNFDFYWYPRRDDIKIRTLNPPDRPPPALPFARLVAQSTGFSHEIIARERTLKFEELEYFVPAAAGPSCFLEVRERILRRHRKQVAWRVLYRLVAADDAPLSPVHGRDSVALSVHQNAQLPWQAYFADIEQILLRHDGRPHWGKQHSLTASQLQALYPAWHEFQRVRQACDPHGVFMTRDMTRLLGSAAAEATS